MAAGSLCLSSTERDGGQGTAMPADVQSCAEGTCVSTTNRAPGPIHTTEEVISSERASAVESSGEVLDLLSRRKWVVLLTTATITVAAALTAWTLPDEYQASVLIAPLSGELGSGRAAGPNSPISLFGSLSSLAGIAIPGGGTTAESLATLQSSTL